MSSKIILLNDGAYKYTVPLKEPSDEKLIINHQYSKKEDQYWRTPVIPDVKRLSMKERIAFIERERQRFHEGCYVLINGELKYLTGLHYDHLVYNTYNSQKLMYFDDERNIFYFIDHSNNDRTCEGRVWVKPRRAKMTTIMCSQSIYRLLNDFSQYITIQSDTREKAEKTYMNPIIESYIRRPKWMREDFYAPNGKKPRKALELNSNVLTEEGDEWLGGKVNIFPTVAKAVDGLEAVNCIIDEFSKWEEASPYETYEVVSKVIQNFRNLGRGKIDCLSSSGDSKDAVKATMEWHKLIAKSDPSKKDQFGKTISGLWDYFISAIHSQYVPEEFTNKFGIVDAARAEEWVWNEINKYPEGTKERIYAMYKLPLKKEHALLSSAINNLFHKIRISSRLSILEGLTQEEKPYVRGRLHERRDGTVYFEPDPTGLWLWAVLPFKSAEKGIDLSNMYYSDNGILRPYINHYGAIGYDPINYPKDQVKTSKFSQACIMVHAKFDYHKTGIVDEKMGMYLGRPDDPHDANKEAMKACKFTGFPCMHERSIPHVYEDFRDAKMLPFLLQSEEGIYGITTQKALKSGVAMLQARYAVPKSEEEKDQLETYPFEDGLRSLDNFDPNNTGPFDPTMAEIMLEHGLKQVVFTNRIQGDDTDHVSAMYEIVAPRRR